MPLAQFPQKSPSSFKLDTFSIICFVAKKFHPYFFLIALLYALINDQLVIK